MQQMGMAPNGQPIISSQMQPMVSINKTLLYIYPYLAYSFFYVIMLYVDTIYFAIQYNLMDGI